MDIKKCNLLINSIETNVKAINITLTDIAKSELKRQVANAIGCDEKDLDGENILDTLNTIDTGNVRVFWGNLTISINDTF